MKKSLLTWFLIPFFVACGDEPEDSATAPTEAPPVAAQQSMPPAASPSAPPASSASTSSSAALGDSAPPMPPSVGAAPSPTGDLATTRAARQESVRKETSKQANASGMRTQQRSSGAGSDGDTYVVKAGDTLASIGRANGVSHRELAKWNNISDPTRLRAGQEIRLSAP